VGQGTFFFNNTIFQNSFNFNKFDEEFGVPFFFKILPVIVSLLGSITALGFYFYNNLFLIFLKTSNLGIILYKFLNQKWYFDKIYNELIGQAFYKTGYSYSYKIIDRCVFEMLGPTGLSILIENIALNLHKLQSGHISHYVLTAVTGFSTLLIIKIVILNYYYFNILILLIISVLFLFLINNKFEN